PTLGPAVVRGLVEGAWGAAAEDRPFLAMLAAFLGRGAAKGVRVLRGVPAQGRRTARAVVRAPRQRGREQPGVSSAGAVSRPVPPEASAEPDELVSR
ncbi:ATP-grasp domain-containing protein, partial [Streptomyces yangpuensis]